MKLFNFVKGIFGRPANTPDAVDTIADESAVDMQAEATDSSYAYTAEPAEVATSEEASETTSQSPEVDVNSSEVVLPLTNILPALSAELQQRVLVNRIANTTISLPLARILSQLPQGSVRVTFGEIRKAEPSAFTTGSDRDQVLVTLPLGELISQLAPLLNTLRPARKHVEVPEEIVSPFASRGDGLTIAKPPTTPGTGFSARPRGAQAAAPVPPGTDLRTRGNLPLPQPQPPACTPGTAFLAKKTTTTPSQPAAPVSPSAGASLPPGRSATPKAPIGMVPLGGLAPQPQAPAPVTNQKSATEHFKASAPIPMPSADVITVDFAAVEPSLPAAIRLEAGQLNLAGAKLALPQNFVGEGLKHGKVLFTWKQIRGWMVPAVPPMVSAHDGLQVNLPLAVIAPLFMAQGKEAVGKRRVVVDAKIPNLFFGFPQPEASAPVPIAPAPIAPTPAPVAPLQAPAQREVPVVPAPAPAETNYFVFDDVTEKATVADAGRPVQAHDAGTTFTRRKATPNEVVTRASLLEGVYGALVALPDGLPVAAKLDPSQNGEAIAALIPQMYSKLSGCTKELRMGELNNLNFTVGNVPWKIFRVNGIFFAAFGAAGEALPTAHLTELARELDYKKAQ